MRPLLARLLLALLLLPSALNRAAAPTSAPQVRIETGIHRAMINRIALARTLEGHQGNLEASSLADACERQLRQQQGSQGLRVLYPAPGKGTDRDRGP